VSVNAPGIYAELVRLAAAQTPRTPRLSGGGCPGCMAAHRVGLGGFGQDITPLDVTPTVDVTPIVDTTAIDLTPPPMIPEVTVTGIYTPDLAFSTLDPATLAPITLDQTSLTIPDVPGYTPPPPAGPSWFSNVASYLTTGGGINAMLGLGTQVLRTQAAGSNVVAAQTILNAQAARVMGGGNPAAISYRRDPITGQIVPVLATATGAQYPVTHQMLQTLAPNASMVGVTSFLSQYGLYLAAGLVALIFIARR
jgi:hypothetical protein